MYDYDIPKPFTYDEMREIIRGEVYAEFGEDNLPLADSIYESIVYRMNATGTVFYQP